MKIEECGSPEITRLPLKDGILVRHDYKCHDNGYTEWWVWYRGRQIMMTHLVKKGRESVQDYLQAETKYLKKQVEYLQETLKILKELQE